eukprot:1160948-Pelagomonas_calceolata.AAC.8
MAVSDSAGMERFMLAGAGFRLVTLVLSSDSILGLCYGSVWQCRDGATLACWAPSAEHEKHSTSLFSALLSEPHYGRGPL